MQLYKILGVLLPIAMANAHSWVEQLTVIAPNGTFVGAPGYARGNYLRTAPGFNDLTMTYLIPPDEASNVTLLLPSYKMCKDTQQNETQTPGSPRLQASAGAAIALRYQENGHVTLPWNQPGKPENRGTVYVYGTTEPKVGEKLLDVYGKWNENGTGGDGRGVLLSTQNFDDGRCYQINTGNISEYRQKEYPHAANQLMGANLWCQQDIKLPSTAPADRTYTLYWVWDWPTSPGIDPIYPDGKKEIYTTCMDVDVVNTDQTREQAAAAYVEDQNLDSAAIPSEFADLENQKEAVAQKTHDTPMTGATATVTVTETVTTLVDVVMETVFVERCQSS
ncbi:hypothetical protein N7474_009436 [Penicillium riverlandense]|uniref:uncharacterized protein n=1 Tax=Penicillium riverlandense TaxID=1903569 RepID=UPI002547802A|nr:uncharacterized protein N7474_009436 [Penicillium riverlandense]KAJ5808167.1 hypothetical protein N7474_009436 [Penicillium riverlandense]